jgi:hypothetical protein
MNTTEHSGGLDFVVSPTKLRNIINFAFLAIHDESFNPLLRPLRIPLRSLRLNFNRRGHTGCAKFAELLQIAV